MYLEWMNEGMKHDTVVPQDGAGVITEVCGQANDDD